MKKCFSRYRLALFALCIMPSVMFADKVWEGPSTPNVLDENLTIRGDSLLNLGSTRIEAIHRDVTVSLEQDVTISGHWAGPSQLYLMAAAGRTIRFIGDHDITFVGSSSITGDDLLIVQSAPGTVNVALAAGKTFEITSQDASGGVQMYVLMYGGESAPCDEYCAGDEYCCDEYCDDEYCALGNGQNETGFARPTLSFTNMASIPRGADVNTEIIIGRNSRMSFLSSRPLEFASDAGYITFDPSSDTLGRMILTIRDTGAFIVAGHYTCQRNGGCITLDTINSAIPAGHEAIWSIVNARGPLYSAGLLVLNENNTLFDLLVDPFLNLDTRNPMSDFIGNFSGQRYGVVIGANGILNVRSNSYLDFVGLALNQLPPVTEITRGPGDIGRVLKMRNPSALFIDGSYNPNATDAQIIFDAHAAAFFRSGIANDGVIRPITDTDPFTINAADATPGVGNIVLDVEGELDVRGVPVDGALSSKIELLSLEVVPTGGSLFVGSSETDFPLRTFNTEDGNLLAYNTGAFLINNIMNLRDTSLSHTDVNHHIYQDNDVRSEPAYIGGEAFKFIEGAPRPNIRFFNARFLLNADVAFTGVDLVVPNLVSSEGLLLKNNVDFVFYSSGACIDNGTGRQMILGTRIGSTAADGCSRIDNDAHLDIMQLFNPMGSTINPDDTDDQTLHLKVAFNDAAITDVDPEVGTFSINTIFLGNTSNISIGVNADSTGFNLDTHPWLRIQGNFFSFTSKGGCLGADVSNITGQGGIFVDLNGKISIDPNLMASFCVMVTKSHNGIVDLPADQVFFCNGTGIATWDVNLATPSSIIVREGETIGNYVFNWILAKKDCANFTPYQSGDASLCGCAPVTQANVSSLPTIEGTVENLIIQGSRFGDPAQILIDGGYVRHVSFMNNNLSAQAPVAVIILRNGGRVGLDVDSYGNNGVTIIADGSGTVDIIQDTVINAHCAFLRGPNFTEGDVLNITSSAPRELLLKSAGVLDFRSFDNASDLIQFGGEVKLYVEPDADIILGAGTVSFGGDTQIIIEPAAGVADFFANIPHGAHDPLLDPLAIIDAALPHNQYASLINYGSGLQNTDGFRVHLMGEGTLQLTDNAQLLVPNGAFLGIETMRNDFCEVPTTDINIVLKENSKFAIGGLNFTEGGVLQIGNVQDMNVVRSRKETAHSVSFTLTLDGEGAAFLVGSRGFVGLGVGIERFDGTDADGVIVPNENIVNTLFNVGSITFDFRNGLFAHDRIYSGDDAQASLMAISGDESVAFDLFFEKQDENVDPVLERGSNFNVAGGGNLVLVMPGEGGVHPIVLDQDSFAPGQITSGRLVPSILASSLLQAANVDQEGLSGTEFFVASKTHDAVLEPERDNAFGRANAASTGPSFRTTFKDIRIDTVIEGTIIRGDAYDIIGEGTEASRRQTAIEAAAVFVDIDQELGEILTATLIDG